MIIDSAFFFNYFNTSNYTYKEPPVKMWFYQAEYNGDISVQIGQNRVSMSRVLIENFDVTHSHGVGYNVMLGTKFFEDRVTIIDFDNRKIAFVDSIIVDSTYSKIEFKHSRVETEFIKSRYVEIGGFKDKSGNLIPAQFVFDLGNLATGLMVSNDFANKIQNPIRNKSTSYAKGSWNAKIEQTTGVVDSLSIGSCAMSASQISYSNEGGIMDPMAQIAGGDGLMGFPIMVRFNMVIDYKDNILYLKPSKYNDSRIRYYFDPEKEQAESDLPKTEDKNNSSETEPESGLSKAESEDTNSNSDVL